jgi:CHAD domain-containing protein
MKDNLSIKEEWQSVFKDRFHKLSLVLNKLRKGLDAKDIHDFRVEIKKLKALFRLFRSVAKTTYAYQFPKALNKTYHYLGYLRELQILHQKIVATCRDGDITQPTNYLDQINKSLDWYKQKSRNSLQRTHALKKNNERIIKHLFDEPGQEEIQTFIESKMKALRDLLAKSNHDDESMHSMRKILKDIQYILSYVENKKAKADGSPHLKTIQESTRALGDFHDQRVALRLLDQELKTPSISVDEKKLLRGIRKLWQPDKEILRKEAWGKCRNLLCSEPI